MTKAENVVLIGRKPVMNYVVACITFFNAGEKQVVVKARGRAISRAVDTVELLRHAFVKDLEVKEIDIGTEEMVREGRKSNVSTIEITVAKAGSKCLLSATEVGFKLRLSLSTPCQGAPNLFPQF